MILALEKSLETRLKTPMMGPCLACPLYALLLIIVHTDINAYEPVSDPNLIVLKSYIIFVLKQLRLQNDFNKKPLRHLITLCYSLVGPLMFDENGAQAARGSVNFMLFPVPPTTMAGSGGDVFMSRHRLDTEKSVHLDTEVELAIF